ncbi:hypothetical protein KAM450_42790 [Aeromonas caviae]|nr:hypothetical protein [Aeromonas caviae]GKQ91031.1 hypothetical protein KAM450_42790 [Aeromonas caviae]
MAGNNEDQDKPQVVKDKPQVAGTANVLKQTKNYEGLIKEFGKATANGLMKKAINDAVPAAQAVTNKDVSGFAKVTEALRSNPVDVAATAKQGMADAGQVVGDAPVSYTHLRAHETKANLVCRLLLEKKKKLAIFSR